jgi:5-methylcytosine-specific restriction protein A
MATRLATACDYPGCPNRTFGTRYCAYCQLKIDSQRRPRNSRPYGRAWQKLRRQVLAEQPFCACGARATQVDHIIPLSRGGTNDRCNLRACCRSCHSRKTAKCDGRWG